MKGKIKWWVNWNEGKLMLDTFWEIL
jgi:hypothetical protein